MHDDEIESDKIHIAGVVTRNFSSVYSRKGPVGSLDEYFKRDGIPGITGIDTRSLIRHIRDKGAMNAVLSTETDDVEALKNILEKVPGMEGLQLSSEVTRQEPFLAGDPEAEFRVAALDFGIKSSLVHCLTERGCCVKVFPMHTELEVVEARRVVAARARRRCGRRRDRSRRGTGR